jgi:hypothetical protein
VSEETASALKLLRVYVEGEFLGHPKFPEVDWTPDIFDAIIAKLHKHPSFRKGPDGTGCACSPLGLRARERVRAAQRYDPA